MFNNTPVALYIISNFKSKNAKNSEMIFWQRQFTGCFSTQCLTPLPVFCYRLLACIYFTCNRSHIISVTKNEIKGSSLKDNTHLYNRFDLVVSGYVNGEGANLTQRSINFSFVIPRQLRQCN
jgi:hypothetical protein